MNCPVCSNVMVEKNFGGVMIDVCASGCKGMWFDWMELIKMDEVDEGFGDALAEALEAPRVNDENRGQINCPKCSRPMQVHLYKRSRSVNVDECYLCGGFFLDSGELLLIREGYMSDEEHAEYVGQLIGSVPGIAEYETDLEKRYVRAKAMLNMTRFVRPSYLVPRVLGQTPPEQRSLVLKDKLKQYMQGDARDIRPALRIPLYPCVSM